MVIYYDIPCTKCAMKEKLFKVESDGVLLAPHICILINYEQAFTFQTKNRIKL